jgi:ABC-type uncharacterized transport system substrate-binding protein
MTGQWTMRVALAALVLGALLAPIDSRAQGPERVYRIATFDYSAPDAVREGYWRAFRRGMEELGYVEGRNVRYDHRWSRADKERLPALAGELVALKPDVIVSGASNATLALKRATASIPIVTTSGSDPVAVGLVQSLRQPGGNITGMTSMSSELTGKRLDLVRLLVPRPSRVAILWDEGNPGSRLAVDEAATAAKALGLVMRGVPVRGPDELDAILAALAKDRVAAVGMTTSALFLSHRARLAELALKHHLPTLGGDRDFVDAGVLAAYGTHYPDLYRRAAQFVDKILKGARPGDLPMERPTRFELSLNLKTAKALILTVPPSLVQQADRVVQ